VLYVYAESIAEGKLPMSRSVIALSSGGKPETLSLRDLVLKRVLQAALVAMVSLASILTGTIISSIFLSGVE
jgi:hypothetical protein